MTSPGPAFQERTLQLACSQKISPSALVVELGRHAGNDYHQFQFAAIFGQAIDNS